MEIYKGFLHKFYEEYLLNFPRKSCTCSFKCFYKHSSRISSKIALGIPPVFLLIKPIDDLSRNIFENLAWITLGILLRVFQKFLEILSGSTLKILGFSQEFLCRIVSRKFPLVSQISSGFKVFIQTFFEGFKLGFQEERRPGITSKNSPFIQSLIVI